jgi:hypothetical protein
MSDTVSRPKKKIKFQKKSVEGVKAGISSSQGESSQEPQQNHTDDNTVQIPPETPVHIMQRVGLALGIDADLITEEKLKADSKDNNSKESPNDS